MYGVNLCGWCERGESNPYGCPLDPKSSASASSATLATISFRFGKREFFVLARKSRDCAEAYIGTPHKQASR
jgi:hypothetical protein